MKTKHKAVEHNGRRYEVQWHRRGEEAKVIVNGVECTDIQLGNRTIFAIIPNGENNLLIEIYYGIFVYIFDIDPRKNMNENTQKYKYNVPFPIRAYCLPIAAIPFFGWGYVLLDDISAPEVIPLTGVVAVYMLLFLTMNFIAFHPKMTRRSLFLSLASLVLGFGAVAMMFYTLFGHF